MAKVKPYGSEPHMVQFYCPGCKTSHALSKNAHEYNDDPEKPTFSPSILVRGWAQAEGYEYGKEIYCHSFVKEGMIQFLNDCIHEMVGKTVELPDIKIDLSNGFAIPDN